MAHRNGYFADVPFIPPIEASTFFDDLRHCKAHRLPRSHMYNGSSGAFFSFAQDATPHGSSSSSNSVPWLLAAPPAQTAFPPWRDAGSGAAAGHAARPTVTRQRWIAIASVPYRKDSAIALAVAAALTHEGCPAPAVHTRFPRVAQDFCDLYDEITSSNPSDAHSAGQPLVFVIANVDELMNGSPACCAWFSVFCLLLASWFHSHPSAGSSGGVGVECAVPEVLFTVLNDEEGETCGDVLQAYWEGVARVAVRRDALCPVSDLEPRVFPWREFTVESCDPKSATRASERLPRPLLRDVLTSAATAVVDQHQVICDAMLEGSLPVGDSYVIVVFAPNHAADTIIAEATKRYVAEPLLVATIEELRALPLPLEATPVVTVCSTIDDLSRLRAVMVDRGTLVLRVVICAAVAELREGGGFLADNVTRSNYACDASLHSRILHLISPAEAAEAEVVMLKPETRCSATAAPRAEGLWFQKTSSSSRALDFVELGSSVGPMILWLFRRCRGKPPATGAMDNAAPSLLLSLNMFLGVSAGVTDVALRSALEYLATTQCVDVQQQQQHATFDEGRGSLYVRLSITPLGRFLSEGWKRRVTTHAPRGPGSHVAATWCSSSVPPEERITGHHVILRSKLILSFATFCLGLAGAVEVLASVATAAGEDAPLTMSEVARWCARRRVLLAEGGSSSSAPPVAMTHEMRYALTRLCVLWSFAPHDDLVQRALKEGEHHSLRRLEVLLCAAAARRRSIVERHSGEGVTGWCRGWYGSSTVSVIDVRDPGLVQQEGGDALATADANATRRVQSCDAVPLFRFPPAHELCDIEVRRSTARISDPYVHLMELPVDLSETLVAAKILVSSLLENNCILSQVDPLVVDTADSVAGSEPPKRPAATLVMDKKLLGSVTLTSILCGSDNLHSVGGATASGLWIDGIVYDSSTAPMTRPDELQHLASSAPSMLEFCDHVAFSKTSEARRADAASATGAKTKSSDVFEGVTPSAREKVVIDQLVETAARIGRARVESDLKGKRGFGFLSEGDPHHAYYLHALTKKLNSTASIKA